MKELTSNDMSKTMFPNLNTQPLSLSYLMLLH